MDKTKISNQTETTNREANLTKQEIELLSDKWVKIRDLSQEIIYQMDLYAHCGSVGKKATAIRRKVRMLIAESKGTHTKDQWEVILKIFNYRCACCGSEVIGGRPTKDHIVPILIGGSDGICNIQPLCRECNSGTESDYDYRPEWLVDIVGEAE